MLKAFLSIVWVDGRIFRNRWKKEISAYVVHGVFVFPLIILVSWMLRHIFDQISGEDFFRELMHLIFFLLGTLWVLLAITTHLSSLNYHHLMRFPKYPFTFRQVFIATSIRALGDRWLLLFGPVMTCIIIEMDIADPIKILIAISGCLVFACVMITWCQVLKASIDLLGYSNIWGWGVKLLFGGIGFSIVSFFIFSSLDMGRLEKYASFNPSLVMAYLPTGLLCELFFDLKSGEIPKGLYDLLGLMGFLAIGGTIGYGATYQHIFNGGTHNSKGLQRGRDKVSWLEFLCSQFDKVEVLQKYAPIIAQELCYLIRSKKNQFFVMAAILLIILNTKIMYELHPALILFFPYFFASIKSSATVLNKYSQGIITYYLLPVSAYQAIIGTNLASLIFQGGILLLYIIYPFFLLWFDGDIFLTLSFFFLQISSVIYFIAIGNFISLRYPYPDVFAFSRFNSRDISFQAGRIVKLELIGYLIVISALIGVFYFLFQSSILLFCSCLLFFILGIGLYIILLPKASQLQERQKEQIINNFLQEGAIS